MSESEKGTVITSAGALKGESPLVLVARFEPVAGLDRFQPAGFPEVGHVIYRAPRKQKNTDGEEQLWEESVCIVDSPASMANHLESVCLRGAHDYDLVDDLEGMPYLRCVTDPPDGDGKLAQGKKEVVVTSLTEGHRIASTYFLEGFTLGPDGARVEVQEPGGRSRASVGSQRAPQYLKLQDQLVKEFGIELAGSSKAHPPAERWWNVFQTIFRYDPNSLVHGVLFPQWQIKIPRVLTAHLEAFGAGRVDRSGVKFDRLGKTTSGQPIFAVDDATAREIRATFILDLSLVRSFGGQDGEGPLGLTDKQKEFLVALALWKIQRLLRVPFRFRSGCYLRCVSVMCGEQEAELAVNIKKAIEEAGFTTDPRITDVWWPREELYREGKEEEEGIPQGDEGTEYEQENDD